MTCPKLGRVISNLQDCHIVISIRLAVFGRLTMIVSSNTFLTLLQEKCFRREKVEKIIAVLLIYTPEFSAEITTSQPKILHNR